nr:unnamed protein product [Digitaria exilis]
MEAKVGENENVRKRSDPHTEKSAGQVFQGGDIQRSLECDGDQRSAMEMEEEEEYEEEDEEEEAIRSYAIHRKSWLSMFLKNGAIPFEAETQYPPMRYTDVPMLPTTAGPGDTMEVFFVKVTQITKDLQWPLDVHGIVAVRDSFDSRRNYLFRRGRDNCQTLTSPQACANICVSYFVYFDLPLYLYCKDSLLELTGPSRAILLWDEPVFEIDLKVKDKESSSSEGDKILCLDFFGYKNISYTGSKSYTITKVRSSKGSTVEVRFAHVKRSVEATITAASSTDQATSVHASLPATPASVRTWCCWIPEARKFLSIRMGRLHCSAVSSLWRTGLN